jgi:hypothetical protein
MQQQNKDAEKSSGRKREKKREAERIKIRQE